MATKFTFKRLAVAEELLNSFQNFNFKKFVQNTGSLQLVYIFRMQKAFFTGTDSNFHSNLPLKCVNLTACFEIISAKLGIKTWKMIVSYYIIQTYHFYRSAIRQLYVKLSKSVPVICTCICPKYYCAQLSYTRNSCREIQIQ